MADWDVSKPADDDIISQYPANARARRAAVRTIFGVDHHDDDDADQGKHEVVTLLSESPDPTFAAGEVGIWNNAGVLKTRVAAGTVEEFARAGNLDAPAGTAMVFRQTAAPTGWTKNTGLTTDSVLRFVTGSVGAGGSWTISGLTMPHTHTVSGSTGNGIGTEQNAVGGTGITTMNQFHTHNMSFTSGGASTSSVSSNGAWRPLYVDVIIAAKD
jgi:hypothetical protein